MFRWSPFPFIRITLSFLTGILCYIYLEGKIPYLTVFTIVFGTFFLFSLLLNKRWPSASKTNLTGLLGLICFFWSGALLTHVRTEPLDPLHLLHQPGEITYYIGQIDDYLVEKPQSSATTLQLEQALVGEEWRQVTGRIRLTVRRDSLQTSFRYGDRLLIRGSPTRTRGPANPGQFDYAQYLAWRNIYHQHYVSGAQVLRLNPMPDRSLLAVSLQVRLKLDALLRASIDERREYGIASALLLGVKDDLDNIVRDAYANTGTMHVLAVSGLHVGLIFGFLSFFLRQLRRVPGYRYLSAVLVILLLVFYAFITGLSPSVLRAVLMFSLFTISSTIRRRQSVYNTLSAVAFALLCYNPYYAMDVGFQLSFLAVLAIVYIQPRLYALVTFRKGWQDWLWKLATLSIAAQIGTFPLGMLYFHQFPVYFLVSNMVAVPLVGIVLYAGLGFLLVSWAPVVGAVGASIFESLVWVMNEFIIFMEKLPQSVITGITLSNVQAWILYAIIIGGIFFLQFKKLSFLGIVCVLAAVMSGIIIQENWRQASSKSFVVYSVREKSVLAFLNGPVATLVTEPDKELSEDELQYNIRPHWWHTGVQRYMLLKTDRPAHPNIDFAPVSRQTPDGNSLYVWQGLRILVVSKPLRRVPQPPVALDFLILRNNAWINPEALRNGYRCRQVVLDTSNRWWYNNKISEALAATGISYHNVAQTGAFVYALSAAEKADKDGHKD